MSIREEPWINILTVALIFVGGIVLGIFASSVNDYSRSPSFHVPENAETLDVSEPGSDCAWLAATRTGEDIRTVTVNVDCLLRSREDGG